MRDLITGLAVLLLVVLAAAFVAPPLIDWESRRDEVARQLSSVLGQQVRIDGPIGLSLLPTPSLKLGHVSLSGEGSVHGTIGRIRASAAAPALLRGQIRLTSVEIDGARISLREVDSGAEALGPKSDVSIEKLTIRDSRLAYAAPGGTETVLSDIGGELDATALDGPWRGALSFTHEGIRRSLRFSTGKAVNGAIRLRALLENDAAATRIEYDGSLKLAAGTPAIDGRLVASGNLDLPLGGNRRNLLWRAEALAKGDRSLARLDEFALTIGPSERQAIFAGTGEISLDVRSLKGSFAARQVDLDRMFGGEGDGALPGPETLLREIVSNSQGGGIALGLAGRADLTVGSLILGGGVVSGPRLTLGFGEGRFSLAEIAGEFPGRALLSYRAGSDRGGPLSFETPDAPAFLAWLQQRPAQRGAVRRLAISGMADFGSGGFAVRDAELRADDMRFRGDLAVAPGEARPRVTARLLADRLDIARLPDIENREGPAAFDLDLDLDARQVSFNGAGAGSVRVSILRNDSGLAVRKLSVRDLGGASLQATAAPGSGISGELDAERLDALLELLDRLSPHAAMPWLKARATAFAPAKLAFAVAPTEAGGWRVSTRGRLGGAGIDAAVTLLADGSLAGGDALRATFNAPTPDVLARQIGLPSIAIAGTGPVSLTIAGGGLAGGQSSPWSLKGAIGGLSVDLEGRRKADVAEPFAGRVRFDSTDLFPLAQTLLIAVPRVAPGTALALSAGLDLRGYRITLRDIDARVGGQPVAGEVTFDLLQFGRVSGQFRTPFFDPRVVAPIVFGEAPTGAGDDWSSTAFSPPAAASVPGDLWIEVGEVPLAPGVSAKNAGFVLRFDNGLLFLEHARGTVGGLRAEAQGTFRRTGRSVALSGQAKFSGSLEGLAAGADATLDATAIGESPAQLMAALSGSGVLRHRGLTLPGLRPDVFGEIATASAGAGAVSGGEVARRLGGALATPLRAPSAEARLSLTGGVLRVGPKRLDDGVHDVTASAAFDLGQRRLTARMAFAARQMPKDWSGAPPQAAFLWRGAPGALALEVEADDFANNLTAAAIRRETARIEALEQDQRERAFFNRRLRESEEERRAEQQRIEREKQERERQERLLRERREAERRRAAEEAARPPPLLEAPPLAPPIQILPNAGR